MSVSIVLNHSLTSSSQRVREESTSRNWSHSSQETTTYRFALIHVTIRVWKMAWASRPPRVSSRLLANINPYLNKS